MAYSYHGFAKLVLCALFEKPRAYHHEKRHIGVLWDKTSKSNIVWANEELGRKQAERVDAKSGTIGQTVEIVAKAVFLS